MEQVRLPVMPQYFKQLVLILGMKIETKLSLSLLSLVKQQTAFLLLSTISDHARHVINSKLTDGFYRL